MLSTGLDQRIETYCESNQISGVLRVTLGGEIAYEKYMGFADQEHKTPFTKDSMFTLYSLSKPFCTMGLLKLKDRGLVDLDAHPGKYVPEAAGFDPRVTVRQLLHHTSGLPDFEQNREFAKKYAPGYTCNIREHLRLLTRYPSYFPPGTDGKYANINFVLCALIIENVSGMAYAAYMEKEVFQPLGMKTAVIDNESLFIDHRVKGYALVDDRLCQVEKSYNWILGGGDMVGTVDDVYCLNKAIKHRLLLCGDTWEQVLTPSPLNRMGMGCAVYSWHGKRRITHNGGHRGFRTLHIQLPGDDFDLIFLSNSGFGNARSDIPEMVYAAVYGEASADAPVIAMDAGYI